MLCDCSMSCVCTNACCVSCIRCVMVSLHSIHNIFSRSIVSSNMYWSSICWCIAVISSIISCNVCRSHQKSLKHNCICVSVWSCMFIDLFWLICARRWILFDCVYASCKLLYASWSNNCACSWSFSCMSWYARSVWSVQRLYLSTDLCVGRVSIACGIFPSRSAYCTPMSLCCLVFWLVCIFDHWKMCSVCCRCDRWLMMYHRLIIAHNAAIIALYIVSVWINGLG